MKTICLSLALLFSLLTTAQSGLREIYNRGISAYKTGDYPTFLNEMKSADSISPMHPTITYNLAAAYSKNDLKDEALVHLMKAVTMNANLEPEKDDDFENLDLTDLIETRNQLKEEVARGEVAFQNLELDLHPESVAFDPNTGHFFLNSIRKGKILRFDPDSDKFTEFSSGHWAVMGMRVHEDFLWACEVATSELDGFDEADKGKTALLKIALSNGELIERWELEGGHWFGDVIFTGDGKPLISDSMVPQIYTIENGEVSLFKDFTDRLYNLQGLALNKDETSLYLADYKVGIHMLDLSTDELTPISKINAVSKGTDGLYFYRNSLVAIQNGVTPFRVTRFFLNQEGLLQNAVYLDKARPELNEPTLGVLLNDGFYYIANSPWGAYKDGEFVERKGIPNLVMKLILGD